MKIKLKEKIGGHTVIRSVVEAAVNTEKTMAFINPMITPGMTKKEVEDLFNSNLQYAGVGPEGDLITDELGEQIQQKLDERGPHQALLDSGEYINDYRDVEYWIREEGKWKKEKILDIGTALPNNAFQESDLTEEQHAEISAQEEADRKAAMTPEQKFAEIKAKLAEIDRLDGPRPVREAARHYAESAGLDTSHHMTHESKAIELRLQLDELKAANPSLAATEIVAA